jgi:hypothetical protein
MARVEWVNTSGAVLGNDAGATLYFRGTEPSPPPSLAKILQIRLIIGDPLASSLVYDDQLPDRGLKEQVYTRGDGRYYQWGDNGWEAVALKFDDITITLLTQGQDIWRGALYVFDHYLTKIDPLDYLTSASAGAQNVTLPGIPDVLAWFAARRAVIVRQVERYGRVTQVCYREHAVGGVFE